MNEHVLARTMHKMHKLLHAHFCIHFARSRISTVRLLDDAAGKLVEQCLCVQRRGQCSIVAALAVKVWVGLIESQVVASVQQIFDGNELQRETAQRWSASPTQVLTVHVS